MNQTAYACTDIISTLSEGYFCNNDPFSPIQEEYALAICRAARRCMDVLIKDPQNVNARASFMWAATMAWNGIGTAGWLDAGTPCHTLEHPLSGLYDLPHGAGLAIVTPAYLKLRKEKIAEKINRFGKIVFDLDGEINPTIVIEVLEKWYKDIGCPTRLLEWEGVENYDLSLLSSEAIKLDGIWNSSDLSNSEIKYAFKLMLR